ncbi:5-hydroxytryptamine receptor 3A-like [Clupea harengus]|uniref:5-hydroxytryptamine receptor 3A-like n=1 Tax=Clupea harengus TaxID=7950 RepID=A0A8M1KKG7_CLUHA|nr:5-hydroxytryptamine receptor 3A-like [Clupea harengus]
MVISLLETVVITNVLHTNSTKYRDVPHWVAEEITSVVQEKPDNSGTRAIQPPAQSTPAHQSRNMSGVLPLAVPELTQICQDVNVIRSHISDLQKASEMMDQWCHVGYILDFLLFRIYLMLITCYAVVIICMWCIWIYQ